ncbi:hypothetical protein DC3_39980 [Deinococcus cellulosilyticus NBRC 106333 = KACC 11606]|uniref:Uncharacterized protein n=1 Tax=Deinococcus cellulosilyticus (strain DSM 18568 / NBRC 106333 / KACC 11606 / 5516J-15) TaxID=1223518 RepID=A0A511N693_DEIC1|nr:hypothetical protein DC3_39980 [Deinococcus cellulosilyticus NBRC 106333 = KACC 11606]
MTVQSWKVQPSPEVPSVQAAQLELASFTTEIGFWSIDGRTGICMVDQAARALLGMAPDAPVLSLQGVLDIGGRADQQDLWAVFLQQLMYGHPPFDGLMESDLQVEGPEGQVRQLHIKARVLGMTPPESQQVVGVVYQVGASHRVERTSPLEKDVLTGLPNRRYFLERLRQHLHLHQQTGLNCAVLLLDLDRFKDFNARHGTAAGDQVLCEVASSLQDSLRSTDVLARLGGDSFAILLTGLRDIHTVSVIAERILENLPSWQTPGQKAFSIQGTIGTALYPQHSDEAHHLLACAEDALTAAKRHARGQHVFFEPGQQQDLLEQQFLQHQLAQAVQENLLEVYYQPILDAQTGVIRKAEALLRWKHPNRGFISPAVFIPLAEESGLIHPMGRWVCETVMQQLKTWDAQGLPEVAVSINLSARQFVQPGTIQNLLEQLERHNLDASRIIVEITESVFMQDHGVVEEQLSLLEEAGVKIALDDFGTGYSSLSYLTRFNPHYIKIDRSFVQQLDSQNTSTIMEAIISMGHHLNKEVVAEGVETPGQQEWLQSRNCQYLQGYLFSRPIPAEAFADLLKDPPDG